MKGSPIHQNLSTSFVDLSLLIRFLRDRGFTGTVRIEWDGYDGEIFFTRSPRIQAREYDRSVGRIAQGQNAFRRILQRSRRPSGKIHVVKRDPERTAEVLRKPFVDERIIAQARGTVYGKCDQIATLSKKLPEPPLPAVLRDETRAALLATDLLVAFKEGFEKTRISFDTAFAIACELKSDEFPFLGPENDDFSFFKDEIFIGGSLDTLTLFEGIVAALRHILDRLASDGRFTNSAVYLRHRLQLHVSNRNDDYRDLRLISIVDRLIS
ncbi:MAG: hypothetical protein PSX80_14105 [bacterium]|nr:hypothetical protein [bacterium]